MLLNGKRLVIVANAEPYQDRREKGVIKRERIRGGLTSALDPMMQNVKQGLWIAWGRGPADFEGEKKNSYILKVPDEKGYSLKRLYLTDSERELFYLKASNGMLWFILHGFTSSLAKFEEIYWKAYQEVNKKYAQAVLEEYQDNDLIWVQDYHLFLLPGLIRKEKPDAKIAFFLHIPWSTWGGGFGHFPWREKVIDGLLGADLLGFHTQNWMKNFVDCARHLSGALHLKVQAEEQEIISQGGHQTHCGIFPLGIDYEVYQANEETKKLAEELKGQYGVKHIIFGLDRIDPTKGILERAKGYELFLKENRRFHKKVTFIQKTALSRMELLLYQEMKQDIDQAVGRIIARYSRPDWNPICYYGQKFFQEMLTAHNSISDISLVTPLVDGMNLVAKEWVAGAEKGVLILSEFAGAAERLAPEALIVNPSNVREIAEAIKRALTMPAREKEERLAKLKRKVRRYDVNWWRKKFLKKWLEIYN